MKSKRTLFLVSITFMTFLQIPQRTACQDVFEAEVRLVAMITKDNLGRPLSYPSTLFYDPAEGELYVTNPGKGEIVIYSGDYFPILSFGKGRGITNPMGLCVDGKGNVYVSQGVGANRKRACITVLNAALFKVKDLYFSGFEGAGNFIPTRMAIGKNGTLYVAGVTFRGVLVLDKDGRLLRIISPKDSFSAREPQRPATINDVAIDSKGRVYLLSEEMGRVYVYSPKGKFLFKFGKKGGSTGKLSRPRGIAIDNRHRKIYVVDYMRHVVNIYNMRGRFLGEFGGRGWGPGWFNFPSDVAVDTVGNVIVADTFNNRIQVLRVKPRIPQMLIKEPGSSEGPTNP